MDVWQLYQSGSDDWRILPRRRIVAAMRLSDADKKHIEAQVADFEQATGAQLVVSVVDRCDSYPELPWRAFALASALAALLAWALPVAGAVLHQSTTLLLTVVLGAGVSAATATVLLPSVARGLLPGQRREMEVRQYAQALFLERELFATRQRRALLVLLGLYERHGVILVDRGLRDQLAPGQLRAAETVLNAALRSVGVASAVQTALQALQAGLPRSADHPDNEIADSVIREQGH